MRYLYFLFTIISIVISPVVSIGQINNYIINGVVNGADTGKVYLSLDNGGKTLAVANVNSGKFILSGHIDEPVKCTISTNFTYEALPIFLENVSYTLTIQSKPFTYEITGGHLNEEFEKYVNSIAGYYEGISELKRMNRDRIWEKENPDLKVVKDKLDSTLAYLEQKAVEVSEVYIRKNISTYVSPRMISNLLLIDKKYVNLASEYYEKLDLKIKESLEGRDLKKRIDQVVQMVKLGMNIELPKLKNELNQRIILERPKPGKYLLLNFWATWCLPCIAEFPDLMSVYHKYKKMGFEIVNISLDTDKKRWVEYIKTNTLPGVQLIDSTDGDASYAKKYGIYSIPSSFLLDAHLKVIGLNLSPIDLESKLKKKIDGVK